jgi:hypothetical protein
VFVPCNGNISGRGQYFDNEKRPSLLPKKLNYNKSLENWGCIHNTLFSFYLQMGPISQVFSGLVLCLWVRSGAYLRMEHLIDASLGQALAFLASI